MIFHGDFSQGIHDRLGSKICKVYINQSSDRINLKDQENPDFVPGENPYFGEELYHETVHRL